MLDCGELTTRSACTYVYLHLYLHLVTHCHSVGIRGHIDHCIIADCVDRHPIADIKISIGCHHDDSLSPPAVIG